MKARRVYLDSNVLIDICDNQTCALLTKIRKSVEHGTYIFPFSAEQISEITSRDKPDRNTHRLQLLAEISRNNYFVHSVYEFGFKILSPGVVYETLNEVIVVENENKMFANVVTREQQQKACKEYGLNPIELNDLDGEKAVERINTALANYKYPDGIPSVPRSLEDFLKFARENTIKHFSEQWKDLGATQDHMLRDHDVVTLFGLLETFGYWADDKATYDKGSRFPDGRHVSNASHFDVLVSEDKRLRNRAKAVYHTLKTPVSVMNSVQFALELDNNASNHRIEQ